MKVIPFAALTLSLALGGCRPATPPTSTPPAGPAGRATPDQPVDDPCEGCEALLEYGDRALRPIDTLPEFATPEPKLHLSGTVYQPDGTSPAPGVIIYIYHTNRAGIYPQKGDETGWARRHGYLRGWVKTDPEGHYQFYTFRPGHYPSLSSPEHIHITIKEPGRREYWIDSVQFEDDPLLTDAEREQCRNRGGSGIVVPASGGDGQLELRRDIVLGRNIPGYK